MAGTTSYDYTLMHQGLSSNVSCSYSPQLPFNFGPLDTTTGGGPLAIQYNLSCSQLEEIDVLTNVNFFPSAYGNNVLAYWACQSPPSNGIPTDSYSIYLYGVNNYKVTFANITCSLWPIQTAIYPVTYHSTTNLFTTGKPTLGSLTNITFPNLLTYALTGLGETISEGQNFQANPVAESVLTFAYKSFNVPLHANKSETFLRLFEQMIQGIVEYEVCSIDISSRHPSYRHPSGHLPAIDILDSRQ